MIRLPNCDRCRRCQRKGRVIVSRMAKSGWRRRIKRCACGFKWPTYETVLNPRRMRPAAKG